MRKVELYLRENFKAILQDWNELEVFKTLYISDDEDLWGRVIKIDGSFYTVCSSQADKYSVRELKQFDTDETETNDEDNIKCPICGYEDEDSWENDMDSDEMICSYCGSMLEWSREISVSYTTEVKKIKEPLIV